ncbi:DUF4913 domain-containing protein [Renibacterium salmoninarum]|uniref:DUF4913 domain-containing protein n=1 Tax=Renibacterium salmoninarum TaxID=1646 RepID=UPI00030EABF1|nr:DUF4913 domain-containing protein [Renibacterium salmoninarum]
MEADLADSSIDTATGEITEQRPENIFDAPAKQKELNVFVEAIRQIVPACGEWPKWCNQWQEHPEAVQRFHALFLAAGQVQKKEISLSAWWLEHWDRHKSALFDTYGVFRRCSPEDHTDNPYPSMRKKQAANPAATA